MYLLNYTKQLKLVLMSTTKLSFCIEENVLGNKSLKLMRSESKKKHYVCTRNIKRGNVIFKEMPFMIISSKDNLAGLAFYEKCLSVIDKLINLAPVIDTDSIDVSNIVIHEKILRSKIATNGFNFKSKETAMLYYGSFFNHSCVPNVTYYPFNGKMVFRALRNINVGEELCISYIGICGKYDHVDRYRLLNHWNFTCKCIKCQSEKLFSIKAYLDFFRSENGRDLDIESVNNLYELMIF